MLEVYPPATKRGLKFFPKTSHPVSPSNSCGLWPLVTAPCRLTPFRRGQPFNLEHFLRFDSHVYPCPLTREISYNTLPTHRKNGRSEKGTSFSSTIRLLPKLSIRNFSAHNYIEQTPTGLLRRIGNCSGIVVTEETFEQSAGAIQRLPSYNAQGRISGRPRKIGKKKVPGRRRFGVKV